MRLFEAAKQADIIEVAKRLGVTLHKHHGQSYKVLCPVHSDTDPSCIIHGPGYPNNFANRAHCYSCGWDASVVDFYAAVANVEAVEAAKALAGPQAAQVTRPTPAQAQPQRSVKTVEAGKYAALYAAFLDWCKAQGATAQKRAVLRYLQGRGLTIEEITQAQLGAVPDDAAAAAWLSSTYGRQAVNAGLLNTSGRYVFKGFPLLFIHSSPSGQIMGITARRIDGDEKPKYKYLAGVEKYPYGAHTLAQAQSGLVYLGEGQIDCIALHIEEQAPALALGGNTPSQVLLGLLEGRRAVVVLDNDKAGERKTKPLFEALKEGGINAAQGVLPSKYSDPGEMLLDRPQGKLAAAQAGLQGVKGEEYKQLAAMAANNPILSALITQAGLGAVELIPRREKPEGEGRRVLDKELYAKRGLKIYWSELPEIKTGPYIKNSNVRYNE